MTVLSPTGRFADRSIHVACTFRYRRKRHVMCFPANRCVGAVQWCSDSERVALEKHVGSINFGDPRVLVDAVHGRRARLLTIDYQAQRQAPP